MDSQRIQEHDRCFLRFACLVFVVSVIIFLDTRLVMAKFNPLSFFENNTTFFSDFAVFRKQWFAVESRIINIKDVYEPVDWSVIRDNAKNVVTEHEKLMVKFRKDCISAKNKLQPAEAVEAQKAIELVMEYLDSVGLVVLKLYEITEKLCKKTADPYSYNMSDYNFDFRHFRKLNEAFKGKGDALNQLLYSK
jgi:hypothetical protein